MLIMKEGQRGGEREEGERFDTTTHARACTHRAHVVANMIKTTLQTDMFTDILLYVL